jgi:plasmid replication initiation protein
MLARTYLHVNLVTKKNENVDELILQVVGYQIAYIDETATVEVIFAPAVVPLITRLEEQFTQYDIEQISGLSSAYAVRMYELLICWRSTGKTPVIELAEFRKRIGVLDMNILDR